MKMRSNTGITVVGVIMAVVCCLWSGASVAADLEDKLVIVTSFPKDLTGPFKEAFEAKYPGTVVDVDDQNVGA